MKDKKVHKKKKNDFIPIIIAVLIVFIFFIVFFAIPFPYTATEHRISTVPYEAQESYTEEEPYTTTDYNTVNLKYSVKWTSISSDCIERDCIDSYSVCTEKNFWGNCIRWDERCRQYRCIRYRRDCRLEIKNVDDTGGTFKFDEYVIDEDGKERYINKKSLYVRPQDTNSVSWTYTYPYIKTYHCLYRNLKIPTKTISEKIIKYKIVTKYRTVTKYREVAQDFKVSKYATLYQFLSGGADYWYEVRV